MKKDILVLGAGMVGACTALELQLRGHSVTLMDRRPPGRETSYGNAGVIQREAVEPYAMPRDWRTLLHVALRQGLDVSYHLRGLFNAWPQLLRYWQASAPAEHRRIGRQYAALVAHCTQEHERLIVLAGACDLVQRNGLRMVYRSQRALDEALLHARRLAQDHGIAFAALEGRALAAAEPAFRLPIQPMNGSGQRCASRAVASWNISDPGTLVERYARLFEQRGGRLVKGDADSRRKAVD